MDFTYYQKKCSEIFHYYPAMGDKMPPGETTRLTAFPLTNSTPIRLTHVCTDWRQISTLTPKVWTSLSIYNSRQHLLPLVRM
ncbi:hypothetical protein BDQ17DRAFT_1356059 [Cyathus striatus]|nr:hypothetical protein BDQ17DRAFT_1356059 [Cyathus striatus]